MSGDTVTGEALQFTNDNKHVYWTSGGYEASTSEVIIGNFTTTSYYTVGTMSLNAGIQLSNPADVDIAVIEIKFNNKVVALMQTGDGSIDANLFSINKILIPPFTNVIITLRSSANDASNIITALYVGKAYMTNRVGNLVE